MKPQQDSVFTCVHVCCVYQAESHRYAILITVGRVTLFYNLFEGTGNNKAHKIETTLLLRLILLILNVFYFARMLENHTKIRA